MVNFAGRPCMRRPDAALAAPNGRPSCVRQSIRLGSVRAPFVRFVQEYSMTAIRPERLNAEGGGSEISGQEQNAANQSVPEKLTDVDQAAVTAFEGEIREFVRRDLAFPRRPRNTPEITGNPAAENLNSLIQRVAGASMDEIDRVILELQGVRAMLRNEGERVSRELAGYASLNHASMTAMKVISDSLKQWMDAPVNHNRRPAG
jgi:hypothetical protein